MRGGRAFFLPEAVVNEAEIERGCFAAIHHRPKQHHFQGVQIGKVSIQGGPFKHELSRQTDTDYWPLE